MCIFTHHAATPPCSVHLNEPTMAGGWALGRPSVRGSNVGLAKIRQSVVQHQNIATVQPNPHWMPLPKFSECPDLKETESSNSGGLKDEFSMTP